MKLRFVAENTVIFNFVTKGRKMWMVKAVSRLPLKKVHAGRKNGYWFYNVKKKNIHNFV